MEKSERSYNADEIKLLKSRKYTLWEHFEHFGLKWIGITAVLIAPLLIYDAFIAKVSSDTQLLISFFVLTISIGIAVYWMYKNGEIGWNMRVENEIRNGKAQVLNIKTQRVIKRKDPEDFGAGYYIAIDKNKTLFLQGQYVDALQYSRKFPNTDFEIVRANGNFRALITINFFGEYIKPERKIKAFSKEQYKNGDIHYDGDVLDIPIDNIK